MKKIKKLALVLLGVFVFTSVTSYASLKNEAVSLVVNNGVEGAWSYTVADVDPYYSQGILHVKKVSGAYEITIQMGEAIVPTEDEVVKGNKFSFTVYVEGSKVTIKGVIEKNSLNALVNTEQGIFEMTGERVKK